MNIPSLQGDTLCYWWVHLQDFGSGGIYLLLGCPWKEALGKMEEYNTGFKLFNWNL